MDQEHSPPHLPEEASSSNGEGDVRDSPSDGCDETRNERESNSSESISVSDDNINTDLIEVAGKSSHFKKGFNEVKFRVKNPYIPFDELIDCSKNAIKNSIISSVGKNNNIKRRIGLKYNVEKSRYLEDGEKVTAPHYVSSKYKIFNPDNFDQTYKEIIENLLKNYELVSMKGSGWNAEKILQIEIQIFDPKHTVKYGKYVS